MARLARLCPVGIPQHIIQRGNNRQVCFNGDEDFAAHENWLKKFADKYHVNIHARVPAHYGKADTSHALFKRASINCIAIAILN